MHSVHYQPPSGAIQPKGSFSARPGNPNAHPAHAPAQPERPVQTKHRGAQSVTSRPPDQEPKLLDQVSKVLRTKHYSIRTEKAYNDWIYRFIIADREISMTQVVRIWIPYDEIELQRRVEAVRGKWNPQQQLWELPYREVLELELTEFIME